MRKYFISEERKLFFKFASGFCSTPTIAIFYSIKELERRNLLDHDSIFINGQSGDFTSGGHIGHLLNNKKIINDIKVEELYNAIINKHYSLWADEKSEKNINLIKRNSKKELDINKITISDNEFIHYYEAHEWICRQSKFVVNGQRGYEWFGLDWRLPLWSDELMLFWLNTPWRIKYKQELLLKYLKNITLKFIQFWL